MLFYEDWIITEDIDDLRIKYGEIDRDIFDSLLDADPTYKGNEKVGKYIKWILDRVDRGLIKVDEIPQLKSLLQQFENKKSMLKNADISRIKTISDLKSLLSDSSQTKEVSDEISNRIKKYKNLNADLVFKDENWVVYIPNDEEASKVLGGGTKWCTAAENDNQFDNYNNDGPLYVLINKHGDKYQFHFESEQFMNRQNKPVNPYNLVKSDKKLLQFFQEIDEEMFDDYWEDKIYVYRQGDDVPKGVIKAVCDDDVDEIEYNAFEECTKLTSIDFKNVESIGKFAFWGCIGLTSVDLKNVKRIGACAFYGCKGLTSIDFKNVESIGERAFYGCKGLTSIDLKEVENIGVYTFRKCIGLTSIECKNVESIDAYAFDSCQGLTSVDLKNVESIGAGAFDNCRRLKTVYAPEGLDLSKAGLPEGCKIIRR